VEQLFKRLLEEPTFENFISLRDGISASQRYDPYSSDLGLMQAKIFEGDFAGATWVFSSVFPNLLLSPAANMWMSIAAEKLGRKDDSEWSCNLGLFLIRCMMKTGDGSANKPFVVLRVEDEYDLLMALKKDRAAQFLLFNNETLRVLDRIVCTDESEVYFDITIPYKRMNELEARKKSNAGSG
jgi:hypothetical protein